MSTVSGTRYRDYFLAANSDMHSSRLSKDGTKVITRIKRITGDREAFLAELRSVLNIPVPKNERDDIIRIQAGGTVEVDGNRVRDVTQWLGGLGF